jgi:tRNA modification GTPase
MFSTTDTIVAIATPPGRGGIGVVRISGREAASIAARLITHGGALAARRATHTYIGDAASRLDEVVATYFPAPHSYTGEDVVELSAHGSPVVLNTIVGRAVAAGARLAEPGEFTLRAFLNGRIDLPQAEAVADLIEAVTPLQARVAFDQLQGTLTATIAEIESALFDLVARLEASVDFPEEGYHFATPAEIAGEIAAIRRRTSALIRDARRGRLVREGLQVVIVGEPNVGKSSLFNALVGTSRAIVTDVPGTTRDLVTEVIDLDGVRVTLVDTAGRREARDIVEAEGVERSRRAEAVADLVLVVRDASVHGTRIEPVATSIGQTTETNKLFVWNKIDAALPVPTRSAVDGIRVSARSGEGLDDLRRAIVSKLDIEPLRDPPGISNVRHIALVERADAALGRAASTLTETDGAVPEEFILADLQEARGALEEISGKRVTDDLLAHIFSRFCIGK